MNDVCYKIGFCFKLYTNDNTSDERYKIIETFINSLNKLVEDKKSVLYVAIIDCVPNYKLLNCINQIHKDVKIIIMNENTGISYATNIGIEYLIKYGCEYIFCSDDDIIIKNTNVLDVYVSNLECNNINLLGYYPIEELYSQGTKVNYEDINQNIIKICNGYSGCFYCFNKSVIYNYGYLPILKEKHGYEHVIFQTYISKNQYDIKNINIYLELNKNSLKHTSGYLLEHKNTKKELYNEHLMYKHNNNHEYFISRFNKYYIYKQFCFPKIIIYHGNGIN